jgi:1,4-dihydroxy-2-naphthoyl-CoA hydrolase
MIPSHITLADLAPFRTNILAHLGIEYTAIGKDYICGKMPVDERTMQPMNILHGGASVVLAESLGSVAANLCIDREKQYCVGLEVNANHIRSVTKGYVYARTEAIHIGKSTQIWETKITDEAGKLVCISRLTVAVMDKR